LALNIIKSQPQRDSEYVFGQWGSKGGFHSWSYHTAILKARVTEGRAVPHWTLHDLRRTMRTGLGRLGVAPHVAELCINHVRGGVQAIYDRHNYQSDMESALALWSEHVAQIV
jgi:hypothetical protein